MSKKQIALDIEFLKKILPAHYTVQESKKIGSVHCKSPKGLRLNPYVSSAGVTVDDAEDEEMWGYVFKAIKNHFADRFQEVFHNTCAWHCDFTVFLKPVTASSYNSNINQNENDG